MEQTKQPAKDQASQSHQLHQTEHKTPLSVDEVRRQLGWHLCQASAKLGR